MNEDLTPREQDARTEDAIWGQTTLDVGHDIPAYSGVCSFCRHLFLRPGRFCRAFPDGEGIPLPIWRGWNKHQNPYPGDRGYHFTPGGPDELRTEPDAQT